MAVETYPGDIWCWTNLVDSPETIITPVSGEDGDLKARNLQDPRLGKIWRSVDPVSELQIHFSPTGPITVLGIFGMPASASPVAVDFAFGTTAGAGDVWSGTILTDPETGNTRQAFAMRTLAEGPIEAEFLTIRSDSGSPLQIGRIWAGTYDWRPRVGHTIDGSLWQMVDLSVRDITPRDGAFLMDKAARRRTFSPNYDALYPEEYNDVLYRMQYDKGLTTQMLFVPNANVYPLSRWPVLGYLRELPEARFLGFLRAGQELTIVEAG